MNLQRAVYLALVNMEKHGLSKWRFNLIHEPGLCGRCRYNCQTIELGSEHVEVNTEEIILDTILHEIAHGLTPGNGHDHIWQAKCVELGCIPLQYAGEETVPVNRRHLRIEAMRQELERE